MQKQKYSSEIINLYHKFDDANLKRDYEKVSKIKSKIEYLEKEMDSKLIISKNFRNNQNYIFWNYFKYNYISTKTPIEKSG